MLDWVRLYEQSSSRRPRLRTQPLASCSTSLSRETEKKKKKKKKKYNAKIKKKIKKKQQPPKKRTIRPYKHMQDL
eukprot:NODE_19961_length_820_cov_7.539683.p4 GENE.NODE_19961_length_820_cov_7.539683~~NODE_19961_length_820_cov_7.539683.p4  ORF type:complete len:75 (+),score=23.07 NODE_19961_length_820_cov_7.539683:584-808(+)